MTKGGKERKRKCGNIHRKSRVSFPFAVTENHPKELYFCSAPRVVSQSALEHGTLQLSETGGEENFLRAHKNKCTIFDPHRHISPLSLRHAIPGSLIPLPSYLSCSKPALPLSRMCTLDVSSQSRVPMFQLPKERERGGGTPKRRNPFPCSKFREGARLANFWANERENKGTM